MYGYILAVGSQLRAYLLCYLGMDEHDEHANCLQVDTDHRMYSARRSTACSWLASMQASASAFRCPSPFRTSTTDVDFLDGHGAVDSCQQVMLGCERRGFA